MAKTKFDFKQGGFVSERPGTSPAKKTRKKTKGLPPSIVVRRTFSGSGSAGRAIDKALEEAKQREAARILNLRAEQKAQAEIQRQKQLQVIRQQEKQRSGQLGIIDEAAPRVRRRVPLRTFPSEILEQTFVSKEARRRAEIKFRDTQRKEVRERKAESEKIKKASPSIILNKDISSQDVVTEQERDAALKTTLDIGKQIEVRERGGRPKVTIRKPGDLTPKIEPFKGFVDIGGGEPLLLEKKPTRQPLAITTIKPLPKDRGTIGEQRVPTFRKIVGGTDITGDTRIITDTSKFDLLTERELTKGIPFGIAGRLPEAQSVLLGEKISRETTDEIVSKLESGEIKTQKQAEEEGLKLFEEKASKFSITPSQTFLDLERTQRQDVEQDLATLGRTGALFIPGVGTALAARRLRDSEVIDLDAVKGGADIGLSLRPSKSQSKESSLLLLPDFARAISRPFKIGREITQLRLKELEGTPFKISGAEVGKGDDVTALRLFGRREIPGGTARQEVDAFLPIFKREGGRFSVTGGRGISRTTVSDFLSGDEITRVEGLKLFAKGSAVSSDAILKTELGDLVFKGQFSEAVGRGGVIKGAAVRGGIGRGTGKTNLFDFGGIGLDKDKTFELITGQITKKRLIPQGTISLTDDAGITLERTIFSKSSLFKPGASGTIKKLLSSDITFNVLKSSDDLAFDIVSGTSSAGKAALKQFSKLDLSTKGAGAFGLTAISKTSPTTIIQSGNIESNLIKASTISGLTSKQTTKQEVKVRVANRVRASDISKALNKLETKTISEGKQVPLNKSLSKFEQGLGQRTTTIQKTKQKTKQVQKFEPSLGFFPSFNLGLGTGFGFSTELRGFGLPKLKKPKRKVGGKRKKMKLPSRRFFTPGFTARALNITEKVPSVESLFKRREFGIRIRAIPEFE